MKTDIDAPCGRYFSYRDLIECSDTWHEHKPQNVPEQPATYAAMAQLCATVLDPVRERFGALVLTYCFSSTALTRLVKMRRKPNITPPTDQHAGCELGKLGKPICGRLGLAADFKVPGLSSRVVAHWVHENTDYDRLYFYADDRPIHVSVGPNPAHYAWRLPKA